MKQARFLVTPELLADMLCLPTGTVVLDAGMTSEDVYGRRHVAVTVEHDSLPEADQPTSAEPQYEREVKTETGAIKFVGWGIK